jgi:hypothetical protein
LHASNGGSNHKPLPQKKTSSTRKNLSPIVRWKRLELPPTSPVGTRAPEQTVEVPTQLSPAVIKGLNVPVIFPKALEPQVLPKNREKIRLASSLLVVSGTVGANMTMFEHGDDILIVDGGLEFARGGKSPGF